MTHATQKPSSTLSKLDISILNILAPHEYLGAADVCQRLKNQGVAGLSYQCTDVKLNTLMASGYIERKDKHQIRISITARGRKAIGVHEEPHQVVIDTLTVG